MKLFGDEVPDRQPHPGRSGWMAKGVLFWSRLRAVAVAVYANVLTAGTYRNRSPISVHHDWLVGLSTLLDSTPMAIPEWLRRPLRDAVDAAYRRPPGALSAQSDFPAMRSSALRELLEGRLTDGDLPFRVLPTLVAPRMQCLLTLLDVVETLRWQRMQAVYEQARDRPDKASRRLVQSAQAVMALEGDAEDRALVNRPGTAVLGVDNGEDEDEDEDDFEDPPASEDDPDLDEGFDDPPPAEDVAGDGVESTGG